MYPDGTTLKVFKFDEAGDLRTLSTNGGDEDYVVCEPVTRSSEGYLCAAQIADSLAVCDYDVYYANVAGVYSRVYITCHA